MDGDKPRGGAWYFDKDNRESFGKSGPENLLGLRRFRPGEITRGVIAMVDARYAGHPGATDGFDLPVTPDGAALPCAISSITVWPTLAPIRTRSGRICGLAIIPGC